MLENRFKEIYLDWLNNYLTIEAIAESYDMEVWQMSLVISKGRHLHEKDVEKTVEKKQSIKFYKNIKDYANQNNMTRQTASIKIKEWKTNLVEIPKAFKYAEINESEEKS